MINILARRRYDEHHLDVIQDLHDLAGTVDHDIFYDGGHLSQNMLDLAVRSERDLVIMITSDFISDGLGIDNLQKALPQLANQHSKNFVIATAVSQLELDHDAPANVGFVCLGGDITRLSKQFPQLNPVRHKNLHSERFWVSLSHGTPPHRIAAACVLLAHDLGFDAGHLPATGVLRISSYCVDACQTWDQYVPGFVVTADQHAEMQRGFRLLQSNKHGGQPCGNLVETTLAMHRSDVNFDVGLRPLYENSFLEIVNETTYYNHGVFVTEKFLNSVYGFNFPILISNPGTVQYLRGLGFDMFDSVIDHSYDLELDPYQRLYKAVTLNLELLTNQRMVRDAWIQCQSQFEKNLQFARCHLYNELRDRCRNEFIKVWHYLS